MISVSCYTVKLSAISYQENNAGILLIADSKYMNV